MTTPLNKKTQRVGGDSETAGTYARTSEQDRSNRVAQTTLSQQGPLTAHQIWSEKSPPSVSRISPPPEEHKSMESQYLGHNRGERKESSPVSQPPDSTEEQPLDSLALKAAERGDKTVFSERLENCNTEKAQTALLSAAVFIAAKQSNSKFIFTITTPLDKSQRMQVFSSAVCQIDEQTSSLERRSILQSLKEGCLRTSETLNTVRWAMIQAGKNNLQNTIHMLLMMESNKEETLHLIGNAIRGAAIGNHAQFVHTTIGQAPDTKTKDIFIQHALAGAAEGNHTGLIKELTGQKSWTLVYCISVLNGAARSCNLSLARRAFKEVPSYKYTTLCARLVLYKNSFEVTDDEYDQFLLTLMKEESCLMKSASHIATRAGALGRRSFLKAIIKLTPRQEHQKIVQSALELAARNNQAEFISATFAKAPGRDHYKLRESMMFSLFHKDGGDPALAFIEEVKSNAEKYHLCKAALLRDYDSIRRNIANIIKRCPRKDRMTLRKVVISALRKQKRDQYRIDSHYDERIEAIIRSAPQEAQKSLRNQGGCVIM